MHDCKGRELNVGDTVMVPFTVTQIHSGVDFCNVNLASVASMPGEGAGYKTTLSAINTRQTIRANDGDDTSFRVVQDGPVTRIE